MTHDPMASMLWVGALMAFTPIVFASVVLGVWWYQKKKGQKGQVGRRRQ